MSDMSRESSAPSGGDPLDIVPDLTEGDDAAPGDEAGLGDGTESSPGGTAPQQLAGTSGSESASDPMPDIAGTSD